MIDPQPIPLASKNWLLRKLARTTSSGNYLPEIDGLRCIAILSVIVFHVAGYVSEKTPRPFAIPASNDRVFQIARTGHIGVQLFFIISGFVVALPFANHSLNGAKKVDLRKYFLRRLVRIEPPYIIALTFWLFAFGVSGMGVAPWPVLLRHFPASLFYLHNLIYQRPSLVLPPAWSLEIEVQFYLLAPLLTSIFLIRRRFLRRGILLVAIIASTIGQLWLRPPGEINGLYLDQEAHYFLIGLLLVDFHLTHWRHQPPRYPLLGDLLATVCTACIIVVMIRRPTDQLLLPLLLAITCAGMLRSRLWLTILRNPWVYTFGGMCYTIYLYHGFFKAFAGQFTIRWHLGNGFALNFLLQSAILIPVIIAGSTVLFMLTEKPFMQRRATQKRFQLPNQ